MDVTEMAVSPKCRYEFMSIEFKKNKKKGYLGITCETGKLRVPVLVAGPFSGCISFNLGEGSDAIGMRLIYEVKSEDAADDGADPKAEVIFGVSCYGMPIGNNSLTLNLSSRSSVAGIIQLVEWKTNHFSSKQSTSQ